jgi:hypothetical protein
MARIRTIKPEFWSSPSMRGADPWVRLLFIALWNWADDTGRGTANIRELAAFAFPDDEDPLVPTAAELPSLLAEVRGRWGVLFYEVGGRRYYAIPSWDTHQRNERRAKSRHPAPEEGKEFDPDPPGQPKRPTSQRIAETPSHSVGSTARVNGRSVAGTGEQGNRGTGEQGKSELLRSSAAEPPAAGTQLAIVRDLRPAAAPTTARDCAAAWVDAYRDSHDAQPSKRFVAQAARECKALLDAGNPIERVVYAATQAGSGGWATVEREYQMLARRNANRTPAAQHKPSTTDARVEAARLLTEQIRRETS